MATILHLVPRPVWEGVVASDASTYAPPSLADEGFIHATAGDELLLQVANAFYHQEAGDFLVLSLDEALLTPEVRWEAPEPAPPPGADAPLFPHVYGPLDVAAVTGVRAAERSPDGAFVRFVPYSAST